MEHSSSLTNTLRSQIKDKESNQHVDTQAASPTQHQHSLLRLDAREEGQRSKEAPNEPTGMASKIDRPIQAHQNRYHRNKADDAAQLASHRA